MLRTMLAHHRCNRRRFIATVVAGAAAVAPLRAAETGPWVLAEGGAALLQLHPDTLAPAQRIALPTRWTALVAAGAQPLGRNAAGALLSPGAGGAAPVVTGPVAASADGRWVCAVEGDALQLRDAALAPLRRWPLPAAVAWAADLPQRRAFVLAFATRPELWQLSYDERAEDFYDGLVHDYRFGEGVPTRAFHNVRRMPLPEPLLDASVDASQAELAGRGWVFNLDARKRVRRQPLLQPPGPGCGAPFVLDGRPALALPVQDAPRLDLFRGDDWERAATIALPRPAQAVLSHPAVARLVALAGAELLVVPPAGGAASAVAVPGPVRSRPRWRDGGSELWVLTDDALVAIDTRSWQLRRQQPIDRPLALA